MRLAVTRPQPDGERSAKMLRARGHDVLTAPLMRVESTTFLKFTKMPCAVSGRR